MLGHRHQEESAGFRNSTFVIHYVLPSVIRALARAEPLSRGKFNKSSALNHTFRQTQSPPGWANSTCRMLLQLVLPLEVKVASSMRVAATRGESLAQLRYFHGFR